MAIRKCPQCLSVVSPGVAAALSDSMECPQCKTPLTVATVSRAIAVWAGVAAGFATWWGIRGDARMLGWAWVALLPFLAFSFVSAMLVMGFADLVKREVVVAEPITDAGHGGSHGAHH